MTFSEALEAVKNGKAITRKGWNGKNQFVFMTPGRTLELGKHDIWTKHVQEVARQNGGKVVIQPYLNIKTVKNEIQIGWLATQSDMLANDWEIVETF
ncbi:MAG TPA: DUF2829 domain-containing protein [Bacilli bacterium]|nr:MAG: hypothetical protein BWY97_00078 [Tenericutes bacterium ADurb.BinA124]HOH18737.1 DUF2829 domain-containing protein [Bacilli bacterium]